MTGTWELGEQRQSKGEVLYLLKFKMTNGHTCVFPLAAGHPIVAGLRSAERMTKLEPAQ